MTEQDVRQAYGTARAVVAALPLARGPRGEGVKLLSVRVSLAGLTDACLVVAEHDDSNHDAILATVPGSSRLSRRAAFELAGGIAGAFNLPLTYSEEARHGRKAVA